MKLPIALGFAGNARACWSHRDLTSCPLPNDTLSGVPAVLTFKRSPSGDPRLIDAAVAAQPHPINHFCCGIVVKQA